MRACDNAPISMHLYPQGFRELYDATLAYRFSYPTSTGSGTQLTMTLTRQPEKVAWGRAPACGEARGSTQLACRRLETHACTQQRC